MSYISTIEPLAGLAGSARPGAGRKVVRGVRAPAPGVAETIGGALAAGVEGTVFLVVMGGLSLTFCAMLAGPF